MHPGDPVTGGIGAGKRIGHGLSEGHVDERRNRGSLRKTVNKRNGNENTRKFQVIVGFEGRDILLVWLVRMEMPRM